MLVLGFESSCDETGVAIYDSERGLLAHALHTQMALHADYGGVVPELASRDHIRRVLPLTMACLAQAGVGLSQLDAIAYTYGPGLSGALLVGASIAQALAFGLKIKVIEVNHLEGHLLSPLLSAPSTPFPFVALLVSGGHTQLIAVQGVGDYTLLGETLDDAAGEAFDKTAKLLGLPYPGGAELARLARLGVAGRFVLPRPMIDAAHLDMSFSGLKTAVLTLVKQQGALSEQMRCDICHAFQAAIVDVLLYKAIKALKQTQFNALALVGGVSANEQLRTALQLAATEYGFAVYTPPLEFCTDNGAMIALAGAMNLSHAKPAGAFSVRPTIR